MFASHGLKYFPESKARSKMLKELVNFQKHFK